MTLTALDLGLWFLFSGLFMMVIASTTDEEIGRSYNSGFMFLSQGLGALLVYALH